MSKRREIQPTKNVTLFSAQSVGQEGLVANSQATALNAEKRPQGFFRIEGTWESLINYVASLAFSRARYQGAGLKACVGLSKTGNAESGFG